MSDRAIRVWRSGRGKVFHAAAVSGSGYPHGWSRCGRYNLVEMTAGEAHDLGMKPCGACYRWVGEPWDLEPEGTP